MRSPIGETDERFERVVQVSEPVRVTARSFVPWVLGALLALLALGMFVVSVVRWTSIQQENRELARSEREMTGKLKVAEDSLAKHQTDVAAKTAEIEDLRNKLQLERQARAIDSRELTEARKQKAEIEATIAARDKALSDHALAVRERDAARAVSLEVTASKQLLEEQVSVLQKRLDDALARITELEEQIRKALAERDEMQDMLRVCQAKQATRPATAESPIAPADPEARPVAPISAARAGSAATEGLSAPMTTQSINTPPIGPGAVSNVLLLASDDSDANQEIVRQVNELTVSREEARKRTEVLEDEVSRLRAEMLKARSNKPSTGVKLAPSDRLRPTSVGNNYAQKEVGLVGIVPDAIGNIVVSIGEGLDSLFTGTHYVPREILQSIDAHSN